METLKTLLGKAGVSNELATAICEEIDRLSDSIKQQHDAIFKERLEKAKKVCLEELAKEKSLLARKVKVYLESKARSFEESAERARKIEESESATKIRRVVDLLTDGNASNADGEVNGQLAAAQKLNARLEKALSGLKEQRDQAVMRAKRAFGIAENALKRNQKFEAALTAAGISEAELTEAKKGPPKEFRFEKGGPKGPKAPKTHKISDSEKKVAAECESTTPAPAARRLDESRRVAAKSQAPAPVLESNQRSARTISESATSGDSQISQIANAIPELE